MSKTIRSVSLILLIAGTACNNCQQTPPQTPTACMPQTGDPAPDPQGNCADIGGAHALRVCINRCKPIAQLGQACTNDLCNDGGAVCDVKLACRPAAGGGFQCATPSGSDCDPSQSAVANGCTAGTYCKLIGQGACPGLDANPPVTLCAGVIAEGGACDSNYSATSVVPPGSCSPCEAGTVCVIPNGSATGTCKRACDVANQQKSCPCTGFRCIMTSTASPTGSYCDHCAATNTPCAAMGGGNAPCCDAQAQCGAATGNLCCRTGGTACTSSGQCCTPPHATATCGTTCGFVCAAGFADCNHVAADGCEVDLHNSNTNCGSCGHVCTGGPAGGGEVCSNGTCVAQCPAGATLCGNTCINTQTSAANCGSCGHVCTNAPSGGSVACNNGVCVQHCPSGFTACNNVCVSTQTSANNCGSCGHVCGPNTACSNGQCVQTCDVWGQSCSATVPCCGGLTCTTIPSVPGLKQCCHGLDNTGQCAN